MWCNLSPSHPHCFPCSVGSQLAQAFGELFSSLPDAAGPPPAVPLPMRVASEPLIKMGAPPAPALATTVEGSGFDALLGELLAPPGSPAAPTDAAAGANETHESLLLVPSSGLDALLESLPATAAPSSGLPVPKGGAGAVGGGEGGGDLEGLLGTLLGQLRTPEGHSRFVELVEQEDANFLGPLLKPGTGAEQSNGE